MYRVIQITLHAPFVVVAENLSKHEAEVMIRDSPMCIYSCLEIEKQD